MTACWQVDMTSSRDRYGAGCRGWLKGWTCDVARVTSAEIQLATSKRNRMVVWEGWRRSTFSMWMKVPLGSSPMSAATLHTRSSKYIFYTLVCLEHISLSFDSVTRRLVWKYDLLACTVKKKIAILDCINFLNTQNSFVRVFTVTNDHTIKEHMPNRLPIINIKSQIRIYS